MMRAQSYEAISSQVPGHRGLKWSKIEQACRPDLEVHTSFPRNSSSTDAMDTDEGREVTHRIMEHTLKLAETHTLPLGSP